MKATYTIVFNRKNKLNKSGEALVQIQVYYQKERKWLSTGIYLKPREWDATRNEVNTQHPDSDALNRELREHIEKLRTHEQKEAKAGRPLVLSSLSLDHLQSASSVSASRGSGKHGLKQTISLSTKPKEVTGPT